MWFAFVEYTPWINTLQQGAIAVMSSREIFARNLLMLRTAKGLSQEALAHEVGIDRTYVSALERRKYSLSLDRLDAIANTLGVAPYMMLMEDLAVDPKA